MIIAQDIKRTFKVGKEVLPDPNPLLSPDEVQDFYSAQYPEFVSASYKSAVDTLTGAVTYEFTSKLGTKG